MDTTARADEVDLAAAGRSRPSRVAQGSQVSVALLIERAIKGVISSDGDRRHAHVRLGLHFSERHRVAPHVLDREGCAFLGEEQLDGLTVSAVRHSVKRDLHVAHGHPPKGAGRLRASDA